MRNPDPVMQFAAAVSAYNMSMDKHVNDAIRTNRQDLKEALELDRSRGITTFAEIFGVSGQEVQKGLSLSHEFSPKG